MSDLKQAWQEYFYHGFIPFVEIEGLVTVIATVLFFAQSNVMSANGMPNYVNLATSFVATMGTVNILFVASSAITMTGLYVYLKITNHKHERRKS